MLSPVVISDDAISDVGEAALTNKCNDPNAIYCVSYYFYPSLSHLLIVPVCIL